VLRFKLLFALLVLISISCQTEKKRPELPKVQEKWEAKAPLINPDSAYSYIQAQVDFGPRVPNSNAHLACKDYLFRELNRLGLETEIQEATLEAFNGDKLNAFNIIGRLNPEIKSRVMLFAHWDTRPFADRGDERKNEAILGANDGASGVGLILEILRTVKSNELKPNVGIDVVFFDAEDYGRPQASMTGDDAGWCLGSEYWAIQGGFEVNKPKFGILLDMVGAPNAIFPKEYYSMQYAQKYVHLIWSIAAKLNYGSYFNSQAIGGITDDHYPVNTIAEIPSVDIIHYDPNRMDFGSFHHTHDDDMDVISKETLKAVGQTVIETIYRQ
jgi:hypothetical protein